MRLKAALLGATVLTLAPAGLAGADSGAPAPLFRYNDPSITESSGLAVSSYDDRVVFSHNDSGDVARFFAVDAGTGVTLATYRVPGAVNTDWEDMAAAPDEDGRPSLWLADIGDNRGHRSEVSVYRVPEPRVDRGRRGVLATSAPPARLDLRYPDGPHDAETLLVDSRRGALFLATKSFSGRARVYAAPLGPPGTKQLRLVATVDLGLGAPVTGGAVTSRGDWLVLRSYSDAYRWPIGANGVPVALRRAPERVQLPALPQGESVAFRSDGALLVGSEGRHSAVHAVRLPALRPAVTSSPIGERTPRGSAPAAGRSPTGAVLLAGAGAAALFVGWALVPRHRRHAPSRKSRRT